jgi:hypothetical protein
MVRTDDPGTESPGYFYEAWNINIIFQVHIGKVAPPVRLGKGKPFGKKGDPGPFAAPEHTPVFDPPYGEDHRKARHFGETADENPLVGIKTVHPQLRKINVFAAGIEDLQVPFKGTGCQANTYFCHKLLRNLFQKIQMIKHDFFSG